MKKLIFLSIMCMMNSTMVFGADNDVFNAYTKENVSMRFQVISEEEKTCRTFVRETKEDYFPCIPEDYKGVISIPETINGYKVVEIGAHSFYEGRMKSVNIPNSVVSISNGAFMNCYYLTKIVIPCSVEEIGGWAFYASSNIKTVVINKPEPFLINDYTFTTQYYNATLFVPQGSKAIFELADKWKSFQLIAEIEKEISFSGTGLRTYSNINDTDFSNLTGLKAYIASGFSPSTGELLLTRVYKVPAGEGILLKGEPGDYEVPYTETDMVYSNLLKGVTMATTISPTDGDYTNFILANGSHGIGFYTLSQTGEIAAGKAYLQLPTSAISGNAARGLTMRFDDENGNPSAVEEVESRQSTASECYDLQGRRIANSKHNRGLYIMRSSDGSKPGKKVFVK